MAEVNRIVQVIGPRQCRVSDSNAYDIAEHRAVGIGVKIESANARRSTISIRFAAYFGDFVDTS